MVALAATAAAAVVVAVPVLALDTSSPSRASDHLSTQILDAYRAPTEAMVVNMEMRFTRLRVAQLNRVRISPARAARIATAQYGRGPRSYVVFESLGGYVDDNEILPDWVGTRSWIPKALPAYLVRIGGEVIDSVYYGTHTRNHYWNVIVNATDGKVVSATTYD